MKLKLIYFLVLDYWYIFAGVIAALLLIIFISTSVNSCRENREQNKIEAVKTKIGEKQAESNVLSERKKSVEIEVKNANKNTNMSDTEFNNSKLRDSSVFTGTEAGNKFCERYPHDSTCTEWRRYNFGR
jgi:uncharacterized Fe-S center protein